jgi:hypothetical protein
MLSSIRYHPRTGRGMRIFTEGRARLYHCLLVCMAAARLSVCFLPHFYGSGPTAD